MDHQHVPTLEELLNAHKNGDYTPKVVDPAATPYMPPAHEPVAKPENEVPSVHDLLKESGYKIPAEGHATVVPEPYMPEVPVAMYGENGHTAAPSMDDLLKMQYNAN